MARLGAANTNSQGSIVNSTSVAVANEGANRDKRGAWNYVDWAGLPVAGSQVALRPPNTIDRNRSRRRGVPVGVQGAMQLETSLGFGNLYRLAPSLLFSSWRGVARKENAALTAKAATTGPTVPAGATIATDTNFTIQEGDILYNRGYLDAENNGIFVVKGTGEDSGGTADTDYDPRLVKATSADLPAGDVTNSVLLEASTPITSDATDILAYNPVESMVCGHEYAGIAISFDQDIPRADSSQEIKTATLSLTAGVAFHGRLQVGQFLYVVGKTSPTNDDVTNYVGLCRVKSIDGDEIEVDKLAGQYLSGASDLNNQNLFILTGPFIAPTSRYNNHWQDNPLVFEIGVDRLQDKVNYVDRAVTNDGFVLEDGNYLGEDGSIYDSSDNYVGAAPTTASSTGVDNAATIANKLMAGGDRRKDKWSDVAGTFNDLGQQGRRAGDGFMYIRKCIGESMQVQVTAADLVNVSYRFEASDESPRAVHGRRMDGDYDNDNRFLFDKTSEFDATNGAYRTRVIAREGITAGEPLTSYNAAFGFGFSNNLSPQALVGVFGPAWYNPGFFDVQVSFQAVLAESVYSEVSREANAVTAEICLVNNDGLVAFDFPNTVVGQSGMDFPINDSVQLALTLVGFSDKQKGRNAAETPTLGITMMPFFPTFGNEGT